MWIQRQSCYVITQSDAAALLALSVFVCFKYICNRLYTHYCALALSALISQEPFFCLRIFFVKYAVRICFRREEMEKRKLARMKNVCLKISEIIVVKYGFGISERCFD